MTSKYGLALVLLSIAAAAANPLPEAPKPQPNDAYQPSPSAATPVKSPRLVSFLLARTPEKSPIGDKTFVFTHAALFASVVYNDEITKAGVANGCIATVGPERPTRPYLYARDLSIAAGVTALDFFLRRAHFRRLPEITASATTATYFSIGTHWVAHGCL